MSDCVYTPGGTRAHYLNYGQSPNDTQATSMCGRSVWPGLWHGTGTANERKIALSLPMCSPCTRQRFRFIKRREEQAAKVETKRLAAVEALRARITSESLGEPTAPAAHYGYGPVFARGMGENSD